MKEPLPDWLDNLDDKLVTVKLNGDIIGRGQLFLFHTEHGQHSINLWCCSIVLHDSAELKLEGESTLCITCRTE